MAYNQGMNTENCKISLRKASLDDANYYVTGGMTVASWRTLAFLAASAPAQKKSLASYPRKLTKALELLLSSLKVSRLAR